MRKNTQSVPLERRANYTVFELPTKRSPGTPIVIFNGIKITQTQEVLPGIGPTRLYEKTIYKNFQQIIKILCVILRDQREILILHSLEQQLTGNIPR